MLLRTIVASVLAVTATGCIRLWRFEAMPVTPASLAGENDGLIMCAEGVGLVLMGKPRVGDGEVCGDVWRNSGPGGAGVNENRCFPASQVQRVLVRRDAVVSAFDPLMGPSCGPSANTPLKAGPDGIVRYENGAPSGWSTSPDPGYVPPPEDVGSGGEQ